jgi:hypothetical protein
MPLCQTHDTSLFVIRFSLTCIYKFSITRTKQSPNSTRQKAKEARDNGDNGTCRPSSWSDNFFHDPLSTWWSIRWHLRLLMVRRNCRRRCRVCWRSGRHRNRGSIRGRGSTRGRRRKGNDRFFRLSGYRKGNGRFFLDSNIDFLCDRRARDFGFTFDSHIPLY